ncbi:phage holin [Peribacillus sp. NJ11]|uniref:phage holin n=1 Tax=Peribacillus sp. NJ11 TaxID=3055861 RepID=UPI0025A2185A|nr:phage holin [Peribacillus sp. NJ11]MDM5223027.1 phage holin [Peribacillus sp. NJ11]
MHGKNKTICCYDWRCSWGTALFFQALGFEITWFNTKTIDALLNFLLAAVPLAFALFGVYKNQYLLTKKSQQQEEVLKKEGLK